ANKNNQRIEEISAGSKSDGIGDDFAAPKGCAHAFRADGDAVGNGDRVELQRRSAGGANALFYVLREFAKVIVAGTNLDPGICHTNERLFEVIILEAAGAKHGARARTVCAINQSPAARFGQRVAHCGVLSMVIQRSHNKNCNPKKQKQSSKTE